MRSRSSASDTHICTRMKNSFPKLKRGIAGNLTLSSTEPVFTPTNDNQQRATKRGMHRNSGRRGEPLGERYKGCSHGTVSRCPPLPLQIPLSPLLYPSLIPYRALYYQYSHHQNCTIVISCVMAAFSAIYERTSSFSFRVRVADGERNTSALDKEGQRKRRMRERGDAVSSKMTTMTLFFFFVPRIFWTHIRE